MARAKSPQYPNFSLEKAVAHARNIFEADRRNPIDRAVAAKHMGYSSLSGAADKSLATMMQYGLLERVGKGEIRVAQRTVDILHPDLPQQRNAALRAACNAPPLFEALNARFADGRFSTEALRSYLMREGFLDRAVGPVISAYSETKAFLEREGANDSGGTVESKDAESAGDEDDVVFGGARVGDLIQWESQGTLQLETPQRVRAIHDDNEWLWVEGSDTAIPMSEVIVQESSPQPLKTPPPAPPKAPGSGAPLAANESEWISNKVGKSTKVRLLVSGGEMGPREIGKLIKLLEAQKAVLEDDEDEDEDEAAE